MPNETATAYLDFRLDKLKKCKSMSDLDFMWGSLLGAVNLAFELKAIDGKTKEDYSDTARAIYNSKVNGCMKGEK